MKTYKLPFITGTVNPDNYLTGFGNTIIFFNSNENLNVGNPEFRSQYYKSVYPVIQLSFDLNFQPLITNYGCFPDLYSENNLDFCNYFPSVCLNNTSTTLFSYAADDSIYLYKNGINYLSIKCKSKYINHFIPYPDALQTDMVYYKRYLTEEPKYLDIIYDQYRDCYYRIAKHRFSSVDNELDETSMTWSILVINDEFKVENEFLFYYKEYSPKIVIPACEGVYIGRSNDPFDEHEPLYLTLFEPLR